MGTRHLFPGRGDGWANGRKGDGVGESMKSGMERKTARVNCGFCKGPGFH